jgi:hypothetical protein
MVRVNMRIHSKHQAELELRDQAQVLFDFLFHGVDEQRFTALTGRDQIRIRA